MAGVAVKVASVDKAIMEEGSGRIGRMVSSMNKFSHHMSQTNMHMLCHNLLGGTWIAFTHQCIKSRLANIVRTPKCGHDTGCNAIIAEIAI